MPDAFANSPLRSTFGTTSLFNAREWQDSHQHTLHGRLFAHVSNQPFADQIVPPASVHIGFSLFDLHWQHSIYPPLLSSAAIAHAEMTAFLQARAVEFASGGILLLAYIQTDINSSDLPGFTSPLRPTTRPILSHRSSAQRMSRRRSGSSPALPSYGRPADVWHVLASALAPCIQRLIGCGMIRSDMARQLLSVWPSSSHLPSDVF